MVLSVHNVYNQIIQSALISNNKHNQCQIYANQVHRESCIMVDKIENKVAVK